MSGTGAQPPSEPDESASETGKGPCMFFRRFLYSMPLEDAQKFYKNIKTMCMKKEGGHLQTEVFFNTVSSSNRVICKSNFGQLGGAIYTGEDIKVLSANTRY